MNALFTDVMTVYNYRRDPDTGEETWIRSVVRGVQWRHNKTELTVSGKMQTADRAESITVDFQREYRGNKPYLPPQAYKKLPQEEAAGFWTLDAKTGQDIAVLGEAGEEVGAGYRPKDLLQDYQYAGTVQAVSDNRGRPRLKHIKVVVKQ